MNKFLCSFFLCSFSAVLFPSDPWLKEMSGIGKIADKNRKHMHNQGKNKAYVLDKTRTLRKKALQDDKSFRQGDFSEEHPLAVSYLQRAGK